MDILSGVASVATVLQLAGQLGKSALDIKNFLERVSHAPDETRRLTGICDQVCILVHLLETWLNDGQIASSCNDRGHVTSAISGALQTCSDKLTSIRTLLPKANAVDSNHSLLRAWAKARLASRHGRIVEVERQLNLSLQILDLAINMWQTSPYETNERLIAPPSTCIPIPPATNFFAHRRHNYISNSSLPTSTQLEIPDLKALSLKETRVILTAASASEWISGGCAGRLDSRAATAASSTKSPSSVSHKSNYNKYIPRGTPLPVSCLELQISQNGRSHFTYAMRAVVTMPYETEIELRCIFFQKNLPGLQKLLGDGIVSFDSINSRGEPLLLFAQGCLDEEAAVFLANQGCEVTRVNVELCVSWVPSSTETFRVLCSHAKLDLCDCLLDDIFLDADDIIGIPARFESYLLDALDSTSLGRSELLGSALLVATRAWAYVIDDMSSRPLRKRELAEMTGIMNRWESVMKWTVQLGANIHYLDKDEYSILGNLIERFHPLDCQAIVVDWIRFLSLCDVDTTQYLANEAKIYQHSEMVASQRAGSIRKKTVKILLGPGKDPSAEVAWYVDSQGPAGMVLEEFSGFGDDSGCCHLVADPGLGGPDCLCSWPF